MYISIYFLPRYWMEASGTPSLSGDYTPEAFGIR
jgi:hypothetical protein